MCWRKEGVEKPFLEASLSVDVGKRNQSSTHFRLAMVRALQGLQPLAIRSKVVRQ